MARLKIVGDVSRISRGLVNRYQTPKTKIGKMNVVGDTTRVARGNLNRFKTPRIKEEALTPATGNISYNKLRSFRGRTNLNRARFTSDGRMKAPTSDVDLSALSSKYRTGELKPQPKSTKLNSGEQKVRKQAKKQQKVEKQAQVLEAKKEAADPGYVEKKASAASLSDVLRGTEATDSKWKGILGTADTMYGSFVHGTSQEGAFKKAAIGTLQASATGAAVQGGLAALNGDDPWEAAKSGAIRGAMLGAGYQTMKTATRVNEGGVWKNTKAMAQATRDTYRTQTVKGREILQQQGKVSKYVSKIIEANQGARVTDDFMHTVSKKV